MVPPLYQFPRAKAVAVESPLISIQRDSSQSPPPPSVSSSNKISPAVLFIIVILAVIFFISGLLHLLVRFLIKKRPSSSHSPGRGGGESSASADALQRQLQQLFHLHDAGLDQAFIDALPVFLYREVVGTKEPFDCAVCLCEFAADDRLRLLPVCGHAFHLNCIDTWLLSNSTCPLCRGSLFVPGLTENPVFDFEEDGPMEVEEVEDAVVEKRVFPVRLGKFRSVSNQNNGGDGAAGTATVDGADICSSGRELGESSSSNLDARRCFSMGSYQYVLADSNLQVELSSTARRSRDANGVRLRVDEGVEGKRLGIASRGESFSVSKIWQWSNKKGRFPSDAPYLDGGLPWMMGRRSIGDT